MSKVNKPVTGIAIAVVTLIAVAGPSSARGSDGYETTATNDGQNVSVGVSQNTNISPSNTRPGYTPVPASAGPALQCSYNVSILFKAFDMWAAATDPTVGKTYRLRCYDPTTGDLVVDEDVTYQNGPPPVPPAVLAQTARQRAEAQLDPPNPSIGVNPPNGRQLVGVPTWLWIEDPWQPVSATATVGNVSSTVTATPRDVQWDLGDGTTISCDGPGVPYDLDRQPNEQQSDCTHTYINRSTVDDPNGTYPVTATVTYDVAWTATTGQGGNLGTITRTSTVAVVVREAQAVIN